MLSFMAECPCSSADRVPASGAGDESSILSGGTTRSSLYLLLADAPGRGPAAGRLVWDQEVGSSNLPAPTIFPKLIVDLITVGFAPEIEDVLEGGSHSDVVAGPAEDPDLVHYVDAVPNDGIAKFVTNLSESLNQ